MKLFKNGVGRPSNETLKKRRMFTVVIIAIVMISIISITFMLTDLSTKNTKGTTIGSGNISTSITGINNKCSQGGTDSGGGICQLTSDHFITDRNYKNKKYVTVNLKNNSGKTVYYKIMQNEDVIGNGGPISNGKTNKLTIGLYTNSYYRVLYFSDAKKQKWIKTDVFYVVHANNNVAINWSVLAKFNYNNKTYYSKIIDPKWGYRSDLIYFSSVGTNNAIAGLQSQNWTTYALIYNSTDINIYYRWFTYSGVAMKKVKDCIIRYDGKDHFKKYGYYEEDGSLNDCFSTGYNGEFRSYSYNKPTCASVKPKNYVSKSLGLAVKKGEFREGILVAYDSYQACISARDPDDNNYINDGQLIIWR